MLPYPQGVGLKVSLNFLTAEDSDFEISSRKPGAYAQTGNPERDVATVRVSCLVVCAKLMMISSHAAAG